MSRSSRARPSRTATGFADSKSGTSRATPFGAAQRHSGRPGSGWPGRRRSADVAERVRRALPADGRTRGVQDLADAAEITYGAAANALMQLRAAGEAENPERGQWRRPGRG